LHEHVTYTLNDILNVCAAQPRATIEWI